MNIGIIGCGCVSNFYANNATLYPHLKIKGAFDLQEENLNTFCNHYDIPGHQTQETLLEDPSIEMVLNLSNPRSHYNISKACLDAGKHVYTEKPLAMTSEEAKALLQHAASKNLRIGCAPCSLLSNTAQTVWKTVNSGVLGKIRLIYANYDDGMIAPNMQPWEWRNELGIAWPAKDEFEIGCTYEHAAYFLSWLAAIFGPARRVTSFSSCQIPDKGIPVDKMAPDFSVGCIEYDNNIVARVTCGLVAPSDKSLLIVGDKAYLWVQHLRNDTEPVFIRKDTIPKNIKRVENLINRTRTKFPWLEKRLPWPSKEFITYQKIPFALQPSRNHATTGKRVDFMLGPHDMASAIETQRPHRLSGEFGIHLLEQIEALQYPERFDYRRKITSTFPPIEPLPWN